MVDYQLSHIPVPEYFIFVSNFNSHETTANLKKYSLKKVLTNQVVVVHAYSLST